MEQDIAVGFCPIRIGFGQDSIDLGSQMLALLLNESVECRVLKSIFEILNNNYARSSSQLPSPFVLQIARRPIGMIRGLPESLSN